MESIGQRLKAAREKAGKSIDEIVEMLPGPESEYHIDPECLEQAEADEYEPGPYQLYSLCRALEVSPAWLLGLATRTPADSFAKIVEIVGCFDKPLTNSERTKVWNEVAAEFLKSHGLPPKP